MTARWPLVVVALSLVSASACERKPKTPLERGAGIFARSCAGCHGPDGRGSRRAGFRVPPQDLTDRTLQSELTDQGIKSTLRAGKGQMPAFGRLLSDQDVEDLTVFVRSLRKN